MPRLDNFTSMIVNDGLVLAANVGLVEAAAYMHTWYVPESVIQRVLFRASTRREA